MFSPKNFGFAVIGGMLLLGAVVETTSAAPTSFSVLVRPDYELTLFDGTPLNMSGADIVIPFSGLGPLDVQFANDDVNDPLSTTADYASVLGEFPGPLPDGTPTVLRAFEFVSGGLTNIVRDPGGEPIGASSTFSMLFDQIVAPGTPEEARIIGDGPIEFTANVGAIPYPVGTVFVSPGPIDVLLDLGSDGTLLVGSADNRTLTVVPEPATIAILGTAVIGVCCRRNRKASNHVT